MLRSIDISGILAVDFPAVCTIEAVGNAHVERRGDAVLLVFD